jgi:hypothetical protein
MGNGGAGLNQSGCQPRSQCWRTSGPRPRPRGGWPLALDRSYSVLVNSFLADGGDNFTVLRESTNRVGGPTDLAALVEYVQRLPEPFGAEIEGRILAR